MRSMGGGGLAEQKGLMKAFLMGGWMLGLACKDAILRPVKRRSGVRKEE